MIAIRDRRIMLSNPFYPMSLAFGGWTPRLRALPAALFRVLLNCRGAGPAQAKGLPHKQMPGSRARAIEHARVSDRFAHVLEAAHPRDESLDTHPKPGMRD